MHGHTAPASHVARSPPRCLSSAQARPPFPHTHSSLILSSFRDMAAVAQWLVLLLVVTAAAAVAGKHERWGTRGGAVGGQVVEKERRRVVAESEAGRITAVDVADAEGTAYQLHFITMDPGALFLPVQLHADMVFYVQSGRGKVTYIAEGSKSNEQSSLEVERGDVYNFEQGTVLHIRSYHNATRERLRIYAIFSSDAINADDPKNPKVEAFSSVNNLLKGFAVEVLRQGFGGIKREVAEAIKSAKSPSAIIPYNQEKEDDEDRSNWGEDIVDALLGVRDPEDFLNKKKKKKDKDKHKKEKKSKSKAFNFYSGKPDVENCYGWSRTMTNKDLDALEGSDIGMFIVNLTAGSMMGPHWNPKATEIAIVTEGDGIVQTVCPSSSPSGGSKSRRGHHGHYDERHEEWGEPGGRGEEEEQGGDVPCRNSVFRVREGDVFVVPRFHPMAQMSFNNDSFVFVGFSTHMGQNHPQFLAGKASVLQAIGKEVLALSLGQENASAVEQLLSAQRDSTILSCISCAEELEEKAAEEERKRREEEEGGGGKGPGEREEEERREREERERREREEQQRREEEKQRREEEERAREEEERRREEEEERAREEEERRRREEEEGGGGRGDEPEREEEEGGDEQPYRFSKKLKKRYRVGKRGFFRSG